MLLGLTEPTAGSARIAGYDQAREPKVKALTGYLPDSRFLSGYDSLEYITLPILTAYPVKWQKRIHALERVGLTRRLNVKGDYSHGMWLCIVDLLVKDPPDYMDDPTLGIDPEG